MVIETNRNGGFSQQILEYHQDIIWDIHQGDRFETIEYRGHFPQITMATVWDFLHVKRNLYFLFCTDVQVYIGCNYVQCAKASNVRRETFLAMLCVHFPRWSEVKTNWTYVDYRTGERKIYLLL